MTPLAGRPAAGRAGGAGGAVRRLRPAPRSAGPAAGPGRQADARPHPAQPRRRRPVRLRDARRQGPVLVNFFASWCAPCEIEQPALMALKAQGVRDHRRRLQGRRPRRRRQGVPRPAGRSLRPAAGRPRRPGRHRVRRHRRAGDLSGRPDGRSWPSTPARWRPTTSAQLAARRVNRALIRQAHSVGACVNHNRALAVTPIRPGMPPVQPAPSPGGDAARQAAQRAFFELAMGRAQRAGCRPRRAGSSAVAQSGSRIAEIRPAARAEAPARPLRPGSLLDIRV